MTQLTQLRPSRTVVVIEDEFLVRDHAVVILEELGFDIADFATAEEAMAFLEGSGGAASVLFTDVRMPGGRDGVHLAHEVHERWPWIALIVTSGERLPDGSNLPENAAFLPKPWMPLEIIRRVQELTGTSRAA